MCVCVCLRACVYVPICCFLWCHAQYGSLFPWNWKYFQDFRNNNITSKATWNMTRKCYLILCLATQSDTKNSSFFHLHLFIHPFIYSLFRQTIDRIYSKNSLLDFSVRPVVICPQPHTNYKYNNNFAVYFYFIFFILTKYFWSFLTFLYFNI